MFRRCQQDRIDTWYREAAKGKARYILLRGLLGWGLPMFIIMTFVFPAMNGSADDPYNVSRLLRGLVVWGVGGVVFGWWLWFFAVRKYGLTRRAGENKVVDEQ